jgi:hypothetical protein
MAMSSPTNSSERLLNWVSAFSGAIAMVDRADSAAVRSADSIRLSDTPATHPESNSHDCTAWVDRTTLTLPFAAVPTWVAGPKGAEANPCSMPSTVASTSSTISDGSRVGRDNN